MSDAKCGTGTSGHSITHQMLLPVQVPGSGWGTPAEQSRVALPLGREVLAGFGFLHLCNILQLPPSIRLHVQADGQRHASPGALGKLQSDHKHTWDEKTNGSGENTMTSPAVSGNIYQMAEVISCLAAHLSGTSHCW